MPSRPAFILRLAAALLLALGSLGVAPAHAHPAANLYAVTTAFTVTKSDDTADGVCDLDCSLREAVIAANASPGHDTITLPAGTYTLSRAGSNEDAALTGDLDLTDDLTLSGALSSTTIITTTGALFGDRVFEITKTASVTIENVTITGGYTPPNQLLVGGGLYNYGTLNLLDSRIISNTASGGGALFSDAGNSVLPLAVTFIARSVIADNYSYDGPNGIGSIGILTITDSLIDNNDGSFNVPVGGGGISSSGQLAVYSSTISNNDSVQAGGLFNFGVAHIVNSRFLGNGAQAEGGAVENWDHAQLTITNSLFEANTADDGAGLYVQVSPVTITSSLFRGNVATGCGGAIYSIGDTTRISATTFLTNTAAGGGAICTRNRLTVEDSALISNSATADGGGIYNSGGVLTVTATTIQSNTAALIGGGIFSNGDLLVSGSDILSNTANLGGGLAHGEFDNFVGAVTTTARIIESRVEGNTALSGGGVVNWPYGIIQIEQSEIVSNTAIQVGGVFNSHHITLISTTVAYNQATGVSPYGGGGGIGNVGQMTVTGSLIAYNQAMTLSGGIINAGNLVNTDFTPPSLIASSTIVGNSGDEGGGVYQYNDGAGLMITGTTIVSNTAQRGGGVAAIGTLTVTNSAVLSNTANQSGGGLYLTGTATTLIFNITLSGNTAGADGGGLYQGNGPSAGVSQLNNVTLANNTVITGSGGGLYISSSAPITLTNTLLAGNFDLGGQAPDCAGTLTTGGYNLIESTTGCTLSGTAPGDITNTPALLAALADNGGGTLTHALLPGSPAIDAGSPALPGSGGDACEPTDQRGVIRPVASYCDIGAFESDLAPLPTVQFSHAAYTATESTGSLPVTITLSSAVAFTVQVTLSTATGTAGPADFTGLDLTLTFTPGITSLTLFLPLTDDLDIEGTETLTLTLSLPSNALLGASNPATAAILDDDFPPSFTLYLPLIQRGPNPASALHRPRAASSPTRLISTLR